MPARGFTAREAADTGAAAARVLGTMLHDGGRGAAQQSWNRSVQYFCGWEAEKCLRPTQPCFRYRGNASIGSK
eukprot:348504-Rhodomonas_salina.1